VPRAAIAIADGADTSGITKVLARETNSGSVMVKKGKHEDSINKRRRERRWKLVQQGRRTCLAGTTPRRFWDRQGGMLIKETRGRTSWTTPADTMLELEQTAGVAAPWRTGSHGRAVP
jgi:hypothetical protein